MSVDLHLVIRHQNCDYSMRRAAVRSAIVEIVSDNSEEDQSGSPEVEHTCRHCGALDHGKPRLSGSDSPWLSWSYGWDLALIALSTTGSIGVDVQHLSSARHWEELEHVLAPDELLAVRQSKDPGRRFLRCWVEKEAFLKDSGEGLIRDPSSVDTTSPLIRRRLRWLGFVQDHAVAVAGDLVTVSGVTWFGAGPSTYS